jgi:hypothetical protein
VEEDFSFWGCGCSDQMTINQIQNIIAVLVEFFLNLLLIVFDQNKILL